MITSPFVGFIEKNGFYVIFFSKNEKKAMLSYLCHKYKCVLRDIHVKSDECRNMLLITRSTMPAQCMRTHLPWKHKELQWRWFDGFTSMFNRTLVLVIFDTEAVWYLSMCFSMWSIILRVERNKPFITSRPHILVRNEQFTLHFVDIYFTSLGSFVAVQDTKSESLRTIG